MSSDKFRLLEWPNNVDVTIGKIYTHCGTYFEDDIGEPRQVGYGVWELVDDPKEYIAETFAPLELSLIHI